MTCFLLDFHNKIAALSNNPFEVVIWFSYGLCKLVRAKSLLIPFSSILRILSLCNCNGCDSAFILKSLIYINDSKHPIKRDRNERSGKTLLQSFINLKSCHSNITCQITDNDKLIKA